MLWIDIGMRSRSLSPVPIFHVVASAFKNSRTLSEGGRNVVPFSAKGCRTAGAGTSFVILQTASFLCARLERQLIELSSG